MPSKKEKVSRKGRRRYDETECGDTDDIVPKKSASHKSRSDGSVKVEKFSPVKKSKEIKEDATGVLFKDSFKSVLTIRSNQTPYSYRNSLFRAVNNLGSTRPIFTCGPMIHDRITSTQKFEAVSSSIVKNLTFFNAFKPFPNRITCIRWVPRKPAALLIGGKGGELSYIPDIDQQAFLDDQIDENCVVLSTGMGPGGEIRELCVNELDNKHMYSLNVSGELLKFDIERGESTVLQPLNYLGRWFGGIYVHHNKKLIFMADDIGEIHVMPDPSRGQAGNREILKCHAKGKISHIEFHPGNENLMTTCGSADHCVKVWDIRMLKEFEQLHELPHVKAVNSCYFNHDGSMALTTDQGKEMRVYSTVNWKLINTLFHPHRQFQHLTPIRAEWHPLADVIVVGRYPDENFLKNDRRTIDFFDYRTGEAFHRLASKNDKICLLNRFNDAGDVLASMQQSSVLIYRKAGHTFSSKVKKERKMSDDDDRGGGNDDDLKKSKKPQFVNRRARGGKKKPPTKKELDLEEDDLIAKEKLAAKAMMASRCSRMKASLKAQRQPKKETIPKESEDSEEDQKPAKSSKSSSTKRRPKKESTSEWSEESEEERKPARGTKTSAKRKQKKESTPEESEESEEERKPTKKTKASAKRRQKKESTPEESEEDRKPAKSKKKRPRT